jgi:hypothetical protein
VLSFRFPSKVGKRGNTHRHPSAHWHHHQQGFGITNKDLEFRNIAVTLRPALMVGIDTAQ